MTTSQINRPGINMSEMTIESYHKALKAGEITTLDLVDYYLNRITEYDEKLKSIININPLAYEDARFCDEQYKQNGLVGPLHGVPVIVKDNIETKGLITTGGSLTLKDYIPEEDAYIVKKLKEAGAIILAKANLHEFAIWGETISSILGQTLNPYDLTRTPGGSSGGTGAAIAADFGLVGIGTDTVNSVRSPASANNLVGYRPTLGLLSRNGIIPYSYTQDTAGPLTRTVKDTVIVSNVIKGYDAGDTSTAHSFTEWESDYTKILDGINLDGLRIGVLKTFFGDKEENTIVNSIMESILNKLESKGVVIVPIEDSFDASDIVENISVHLHDFKDHLNSYLKELPETCKYKTMKSIYESGLIHPGIVENIEKALKLSTNSFEYLNRLQMRNTLRDEILNVMARENLKLLIYPHQKQLVCKVGESQKERNGVISSVTGFPSICLPAGFSSVDEDATVGVPVGFEVLGRPFDDETVLGFACQYEKQFDFRKAPLLKK